MEDRELMTCGVWPKQKASILSDFLSRATTIRHLLLVLVVAPALLSSFVAPLNC